jgi:indolepyruvate ferredoxin oxidoreductase beta subunit
LVRKSVSSQIVISGVGGQGVLFITKLLAEAAVMKGYPVFTSETHGMAQRGGTVVSHLKIGDFSSPLVRPYHADGLIAMKPESVLQHGSFLKSGAWIFVNGTGKPETGFDTYSIDADSIARKAGNPKSVNLVLLGFSLRRDVLNKDDGSLFCTLKDIKSVLSEQLKGKDNVLEASIKALEAGYNAS